MNIVNYLNETSKKIEEIQNEAKKTLGEGLKQFLQENPEINSIKWNQWIPGFNDGDVCTFRLGEIYFTTQSLQDDEDSWGDT